MSNMSSFAGAGTLWFLSSSVQSPEAIAGHIFMFVRHSIMS